MTTRVIIANPSGPDNLEIHTHDGEVAEVVTTRVVKKGENVELYIWKGRTISINEILATVVA